MPTQRTVSDIKAKLLKPALTSHFEVEIPVPNGLTPEYLAANGLPNFRGSKQEILNLLCSETVLPGSNIGTMEITNDYHGVTVRHANRRIYDDRIDMTFYVDADYYIPIRFFETWIKYIVGESITGSNNRPGSRDSNYFYRLNYPDLYISRNSQLKVIKFEKDYQKSLTYEFIDAFPISVSSMPVSYDTSSLLKCTVSFSYVRYVLTPTGSEDPPADSKSSPSSSSSLTADQIAKINQLAFDPKVGAKDLGLDYGKYTTTGGVSFPASLSSGNTITNSAFNSGTSLLG